MGAGGRKGEGGEEEELSITLAAKNGHWPTFDNNLWDGTDKVSAYPLSKAFQLLVSIFPHAFVFFFWGGGRLLIL